MTDDERSDAEQVLAELDPQPAHEAIRVSRRQTLRALASVGALTTVGSASGQSAGTVVADEAYFANYGWEPSAEGGTLTIDGDQYTFDGSEEIGLDDGGVGTELVTPSGQASELIGPSGQVLWERVGIPDSAVYRWVLDSVGDGTAEDSVGTADGTVNGVTSTSGTWVGDAAGDGDGTGDYIATTAVPDFASVTDTNVAIAFTVQTTATGYLLGSEETNGDAVVVRTGVRTAGGDINILFRDPAGDAIEVYAGSGLVDDGNPHRVVINKTSNSPSGLNIIIDDSARSTTTQDDQPYSGTGPLTHALYIFARKFNGSPDGYADAILNDVILFNDSLTSQQITDDYQRQPWS